MLDTTIRRRYRPVLSGLLAAVVALAVTLMGGVGARADAKPKEHTLTIAVAQRSTR